MRKLLVVVLVSVLLAGLATTALAARSVKVGDNYYVRPKGVPTVTVGRGTVVRWNFTGKKSHNVTVRSGPAKFHSPTKDSGSYAHKMTRRGTYVIYCTVHGFRDQHMRLVVK